jgi:hypothetical protein
LEQVSPEAELLDGLGDGVGAEAAELLDGMGDSDKAEAAELPDGMGDGSDGVEMSTSKLGISGVGSELGVSNIMTQNIQLRTWSFTVVIFC